MIPSVRRLKEGGIVVDHLPTIALRAYILWGPIMIHHIYVSRLATLESREGSITMQKSRCQIRDTQRIVSEVMGQWYVVCNQVATVVHRIGVGEHRSRSHHR